ncbi:FeoB-associated Cys-rich membrane protein [Seleniivibrio sp.]|uniref:FeoB-associated Cys-rich membrane protein n=1 Tax=Seleniivibrio sp. TaxID=2898801 RepID=UPI0025DE9865|nr:FeoB-associated Cys-rich membrane protein [Seleniivibrio sp.]MCD8553090.1 FeoB-associated Cys-rich membrane protein [Seleniivibrio sp.]
MISNVILAVILLWALGYAGNRAWKTYKQAKGDKPMECACSGCGGSCSSGKKI